MTSALIGHTGFVGSNLLAQGHFDECYNSKNIEDIRGRSFDRVVCAGVRAVKWEANERPREDWEQIERLIDCIGLVGDIESFTLISTVDVLSDHPYGCHRLMLENFVRDDFDNHRIVRLPALFGPGLKKNVLFDLTHGHMLDRINPDSRYQWFPIRRLSRNLEYIEAMAPEVFTLATEPIATRDIIERFFPDATIGANAGPAVYQDIRPYVMGREQVFDEMATFIQSEMK